MPGPDSTPPVLSRANERFDSTHWSVVLEAARTQSPEAEAALAQLCETYWYPLYAYLRRKGSNPGEAEDLTQSFFAERVVTRAIFRGIDPARGRFRTWLLNCLQNFVRNEHARRNTLKRGGEQPHVPIDLGGAEERYGVEPAHLETPDALFDRAWAMTLLRQTLDRMEAHYVAKGDGNSFKALRPFLTTTDPAPSMDGMSIQLGRTPDAVKMAVSRLRKEYGRRLRAELKRTVSHPDDLDGEWRHLMNALLR